MPKIQIPPPDLVRDALVSSAIDLAEASRELGELLSSNATKLNGDDFLKLLEVKRKIDEAHSLFDMLNGKNKAGQ